MVSAAQEGKAGVMTNDTPSVAWNGPPLEDFTLWAIFQPGNNQKPDIPLLKESVQNLCHMTMQKTAGQRKNKHDDIPSGNLDRIKWTILVEACLLVLSGKLDALDDGEIEPKTE